MTVCRIGVLQMALQTFDSWDLYQQHIIDQIAIAKKNQAQIVLMPEYAGLELNALSKLSIEQHFEAIQQWLDRYIELFSRLAVQNQIIIQPGTLPFKEKNNRWRNRAYIFMPNGKHDFQDKIFLTKYEKSLGILTGGNNLQIITTSFGKIAIAICYDIEFPGLVSQLVKAGVQLLLVPSCTDTLQGFHRVHLCCRARAIENQIFVANTFTVQSCPWSEMIDHNIGQAGVFAPCDGHFNDNGIIILGEMNLPQWYFATLDFSLLEECRTHGAVANYVDQYHSNIIPAI